MKSLTSIVFVILSGLSAFASAAPQNHAQCECTPAITDELVFEVSMATFQERRSTRDPPCCDWTSNGCSWSPDNPFGFDFSQACERHDFGYRNFEDQNRFSEENRLRIDDQFRSDLYNQCEEEGDEEEVCKFLANVYYAAVRRCGDGNCLDRRSKMS